MKFHERSKLKGFICTRREHKILNLLCFPKTKQAKQKVQDLGVLPSVNDRPFTMHAPMCYHLIYFIVHINQYFTVSKRNYRTQKFRTARCLQHVNLNYIAIRECPIIRTDCNQTLIFHQQNIAHDRKCVQYYSVRHAVIPFADCDLGPWISKGTANLVVYINNEYIR